MIKQVTYKSKTDMYSTDILHHREEWVDNLILW